MKEWICRTVFLLACMAASATYADADLTLGATESDDIAVGHAVTLNGTQVHGGVMAGHDISATGCAVQGTVLGGHDVTLDRCTGVQAVQAGHRLTLTGTNVSGDIKSGHGLALKEAIVEGNALSGHGAEVTNSEVRGTLHVAADQLALTGSTVGGIIVEVPQFTSRYTANINQIAMNGMNIVGNGSTIVRGNNGIVVGRGGGSVTVGRNGTSNVNGFTIRSTGDSTTVITPDNTIYVNGKKVSGNGPKTYAEYDMGPQIQGPGWVSTGGNTSSPDPSLGMKEAVVELKPGSRVLGDVTFRGGQGVVLLHPGAEMIGQVHQGRLKKL